jgi:hypothetical protein
MGRVTSRLFRWTIPGLLTVPLANYGSAQVMSTISIPTNSCCSVDVNSLTNRVFISGGASSGQAVTMIDGNRNAIIKTLGVGSGARVNALTSKVYAAAVFTPLQGFLVYDGVTGNLLKTITAFDCPVSTAVDSATNRIWGGAQCGSQNDAVFAVNGSTDTLLNPPGRIGSGGVMGNVVVNPVTHFAYISPSGVSKRVDPNTFSVSVNPFAGTVTAADPVRNRLYASDQKTNHIQVIDGSTNAVLATFPGSGFATVNPTVDRVYVADNLSHSILVVDGAGGTQLGSISIPGKASFGEISVNSASGMIYLATIQGTAASVLVIKDNVSSASAAKQVVVKEAGVGSGTITSIPTGISCNATTNECTGSFPTGATVTLTAVPAANSNFGGWNGCDSVSGSKCTINVSKTPIVTMTFALANSALSVAVSGAGHGTVSSIPAAISCGSPAPTSPALTACVSNFAKGTLVTLTGVPGENTTFGGWTGCGSVSGLTCTVTMTSSQAVSVNFLSTPAGPPPTNSLIVQRTGGGTGTVQSALPGALGSPPLNCTTQCTSTFNVGSHVILTAAPGTNSVFGGWSGCDSVAGQSCSVTITAGVQKTVTVNFTQGNTSLTVQLSGPGFGTVGSLPAGISCGSPAAGTFPLSACTSSFAKAAKVVLTGVPGAGSTFGGWRGCDSTSWLTCTVTLTLARNVSVDFLSTPFGAPPPTNSLVIQRSGGGTGTVTTVPPSPLGAPPVNCTTPCTSTFNIGSQVSLTAIPGANSTFGGWTGCESTTGSVCKVTITAGPATTVSASFPSGTTALTVQRTGSGFGTVGSLPAGIGCGVPSPLSPALTACSNSFAKNTKVVLTGVPGESSTFGGWTGCDSTSWLICTVTLTAARGVSVNFLSTPFGAPPPTNVLAVQAGGGGRGTITSNPTGIPQLNCTTSCNSMFNIGSQVTLTAFPDPGSIFGGWTGCESVANNMCTVTIVTGGPRSVSATFTRAQAAIALSIIRSGTGTAFLTSNPPGINCGPNSGNPCQAKFSVGTKITIKPALSPFSKFGGWSGCDSVTGTACTVTLGGPRQLFLSLNGS